MKEFSSQDGGRYTFVDDILNLQELSLAIVSIFSECAPFVVSGCKLSGNTVSAGYVYINGKLRYFSGGTVAASASGKRYLYEVNSRESVPYVSGGTKVGRINYGVGLSSSVPLTSDTMTGTPPQYVTVDADGSCPRLKDAFLGLYAIIKESPSLLQTVKGAMNFAGAVEMSDRLVVSGRVQFSSTAGATQCFQDGSAFNVQTTSTNGSFRMTLSPGNGLQIYSGEKCIARISEIGVLYSVPLTSACLNAGEIRMIGADIFNVSEKTDEGCVNINMLSFDGGTDVFRNTNIGDGKGHALLSVNGKGKNVTVDASFVIEGDAASEAILRASVDKTDSGLIKSLCWQDVNKEYLGHIGYTSANDCVFYLQNLIGDISLVGIEFVDIGPVIKEGGQLLSEKYMLKTSFEAAIKDKVNTTNVYSRTDAEKTFASIKSGLSQFAVDKTTSELRAEIEAIGKDELKGYALLENNLSDMATTEDAKKAIRKNIGAAGVGDFEPKVSDTGWKAVGATGLFARQIGNIVNIIGTVSNIHSGVVFTLPNGIEPPPYAVGYTWNVSGSGAWSCRIPGNSRTCEVTYCNDHGHIIPFQITYMV